MQDPQPLDYHVPHTRQPHPPMRHFAGQAVIWTFVALVATVVSLGVVPRFETMFADMKVALPALTLLVFKFCGWMRMGGVAVFWVMPLAVPFVLSRIVPADETGRPTRAAMAMIRFGTLLLLVLAVLIFGYAVFGPLLALISAVTGA